VVRGWPYHESGRLVDWIGVRCMIRVKPDDSVRPPADALQQTVTPARPDSASAQARTEPQVVAVPQRQPIATAPVSPVQQATYSSSVWPERSRAEQPTTYSSPWSQHTQQAWSARHRQQPTVPRFLAVIQQNLRALFR
jgi:hypothetical protein